MKVRELVNLIGTCSVRRIFSYVQGRIEGGASDPGKDTGLPVVGECDISAFPIYFGLTSSTQDYRITIGQKAAGAVRDALPNAALRMDKWYCIDPQFHGYRTIAKEKVPKLVKNLGYLGQYLVVSDAMMPGGNNNIDEDAVLPLLADIVLRFDEKSQVREDAIKAGCRYMNGPAELAADMPHIAVLTRSDMAIEYDFRLQKWRDVPNLPTISSLNNKSQHRDFVSICQPGQCRLKGEDVAKLVLSTQDAIKMFGQKYADNLTELLTPTRFKVLHPLDTTGYFLRMSASTIATSSTKAIAVPAISHFPVWLHSCLHDRYYEINLGFAQIAKASLPVNAVVAGKLGTDYEVLYDPDAEDLYDTEQLAYLACYVMKSSLPNKEGDGVIAMYGCMEHLNSIFAPIVLGKGVNILPEIRGTRIENLDPDKAGDVLYSAAYGLSTACAKSLLYDAESDSVQQSSEAMVNRELALTGECTRASVSAIVFARALVRFSEAKPFEVWEAGLAERLQLELVTPPMAAIDFFKEAPHANDPVREAKPRWLILKVGDKAYTVNSYGSWAELVDTGVPADYLEIGSYFCGQLYAKNQDVKASDSMLTTLLLSTAQYFVSFGSAQTVFKYLYNMDAESGRWNPGGAGQSDECILLASPDAGVLSYNPETHLWSHVPYGGDGSLFKHMGPFNYNIPDTLSGKLTADILSTACKSLSVCSLSFQGLEAVAVPDGFRYPRTVPKAVDVAPWVIDFGQQSYTAVDGGWALYMGNSGDSAKEGQVSDEDFISLVIDYIYYFMCFSAGNGNQYSIYEKLFGGRLEAVLTDEPDYTVEGCMWLDRDKPLAMGPCAVRTRPRPDLPRKDSAASNIMCVNMDLQSSIGVITLKDFAEMLNSLNNLNRVVEEFLADNPALRGSAFNAQREFVSRQGALSDALEAKVETPAINPAILSVGPYCWDGKEWHRGEAELDGSAESCCGQKVRYSRALQYMPIDCRKAVIELYTLTALLWEPKPEYFAALETVRKR